MNAKTLIEQMNAYYKKHAPWHDECMSYTGNAKMEKLLAPIIECCEEYITGKEVLEIACGTGNWTQVLAKRARSVLATDVNETVLEIARKKSFSNDKVAFQVADAYSLNAVDGIFNVAFAADWWSHIPKSAISIFLESLHGKLCPGARVIIIDMSFRDIFAQDYYLDEEGNAIYKRRLPNGQEFEVVKNFPTPKELLDIFNGIVNDIEYREFDSLKRWLLTYTTK